MNREPDRGLEQGNWRIRFPEEVGPKEREEVLKALGGGLVPGNRILETHSRVKRFYRVKTGGTSIFVKVREFGSLSRRLGRALRATKEERELANYELLRSSGVPCPRALASARLRKGLFTQASALLTEFLDGARPLRELILRGEGHKLVEPLLSFLGMLRGVGVVHQDLQWENLLVGSPQEGYPLYLVDPLHVRSMAGPNDTGFSRSLAWLLGFMIHGGAPQQILQALAEGMARQGLCSPLSGPELLRRAREIWQP